MTISSPTRIAQYTGNGTSVFSFSFKVFSAADLLVVRTDTTTGADTTLVVDTDYTVTLYGDQNTNPGGNVTTVDPVAVGQKLTITSDIANLQPTDLSNQGGFYPSVINDALDRATIQIQQVASSILRTVVAPVSDGDSNDLTLPNKDTRANKYLAFDANGVPVAADGTDTPNITSGGDMTITANNAGSNVARDVIFYDNNAERMRVVGATGRLGVGTSSPAGTLGLASDAVIGNQAITGTSGTFHCGASAGVSYLQSGQNMTALSAAPLVVTAIGGGPEWVRMQSTGMSVGAVGAPQNKLHVDVGTATGGAIQLTNGSTSGTTSTSGVQMRIDSAGAGYLWNYSSAGLLFGTAGTERFRIDTNGRASFGYNSTSSTAKFRITGTTTDNTEYALLVNDSALGSAFSVRNDGTINTGLLTASPYNATTATAANCVIGTGGALNRSTSSQRYKHDIVNAAHGLSEVMQLRSVTYKGNNDGNTIFGGLIAEEVHDAGLTEFVQYDSQGRPDALAYGNMVALAFKAIQELKAVVDAQAARIAALEARV